MLTQDRDFLRERLKEGKMIFKKYTYTRWPLNKKNILISALCKCLITDCDPSSVVSILSATIDPILYWSASHLRRSADLVAHPLPDSDTNVLVHVLLV